MKIAKVAKVFTHGQLGDKVIKYPFQKDENNIGNDDYGENNKAPWNMGG